MGPPRAVEAPSVGMALPLLFLGPGPTRREPSLVYDGAASRTERNVNERRLAQARSELPRLAAEWRDAAPRSRRQLLISLAGMVWGLAVPRALVQPAQDACLLTPAQTEGPFYPVRDQADKDNDLTQVAGASGRAEGPVIVITGRVRDLACRPVAGALVEIWQANAKGRYHHPDDARRDAPLDPNFQYWGLHRTDAEGRYRFITVLPAPYPAGFLWTRPAHVHFKVRRAGAPVLTTQMYFAGDPYLAQDRIFQAIPPPQRPRVVVALEPSPTEPARRLCRFDITVG